MAKDDLEDTQINVLGILSDLEWWTIRKACRRLDNSGADQAIRRLSKRGLLEVRIGKGVSHQNEYRLSSAGLELFISKEA